MGAIKPSAAWVRVMAAVQWISSGRGVERPRTERDLHIFQGIRKVTMRAMVLATMLCVPAAAGTAMDFESTTQLQSRLQMSPPVVGQPRQVLAAPGQPRNVLTLEQV